MRFVLLTVFAALLGVTPSVVLGDEPAKGKWEIISEVVTASVKPGYPGKTAGVTVDPANGDVYMVVPDQGLWKSTDQGAKFKRVDGENIGGRCETGFALNFDPAGKRLACFMIYGSSASSADGGGSWSKWKTSHLDFGAVDWSDTGKCFLAIRHESGGMLTMTADAGETWNDLGKGFSHVGVLDAKTFVCVNAAGLSRSADAGQTWKKVADVKPTSYVMVVREGAGYWATEKGLLVSRDQGENWKVEGAAISVVHGPWWSKDGKRMVVVGKEGFQESTDEGKTFSKAASLPEGFTIGGVGPNYAWDSANDIFYASSMGKPTLRLKR